MSNISIELLLQSTTTHMKSKKIVKQCLTEEVVTHKASLRNTLPRREQYLYTNIHNLYHTLKSAEKLQDTVNRIEYIDTAFCMLN